MTRLGLLASGRGTTMQAVIDACEEGLLEARPSLVISNNSKSGAAIRAEHYSIAFRHLSSRTHSIPEELDQSICQALTDHDVDLVVLVGYVKKLGPVTLSRFRGRVLNTHPSLLPKYGGRGMYGDSVHEAVLANNDTVTGVTVHAVTSEYDSGPVTAQCRIPVLADDTPESLARRVQAREKLFLVEVLHGIVTGRIPFLGGQEPSSQLLRR